MSRLGSQISRLAILLYVFSSQNTLKAIAWLVVIETVSGLVASPFAGVIADRRNKVLVMISGELIRAIAIIGIIVYLPRPAVIYCLLIVHGFSTTMFEATRHASIPFILPRAFFTSANALEESSTHIILIVGPLIGAALYLHLGPVYALGVAILLSSFSALLISRVRIRFKCDSRLKTSTSIKRLIEGIRYVSQNVIVRHLTVLSFISVLAASLWWPLAPFFMRDTLNVDASFLSIQTAVFGIAGLIGAIGAPMLAKRVGRGNLLFVGLLSEAAAMLIYSRCKTLFASSALFVIWGGAVSLILISYRSILQHTVNRSFLGRVFAIAIYADNIAVLAAVGVAMTLYSRLGAANTYCLFALLYFAAVALLRTTRGGRALRRIA